MPLTSHVHDADTISCSTTHTEFNKHNLPCLQDAKEVEMDWLMGVRPILPSSRDKAAQDMVRLHLDAATLTS